MSFDVKRWDGKPISEPGLYVDVPMVDYHGQLTEGPSISSSGLRTIFHDSPAHYWDTCYLNPDREIEEPSEAFIFGRAAHHLLLGEKDFRRHFIVRPELYWDNKEPFSLWERPETPQAGAKPWNSNANWCKAWLSVSRRFGWTVLTANDIKAIRGMATSLAKDPLVQAGILNGLIEHSFVWRDEETGIWLKWRPDAIPTDSLNFADLKTAADLTSLGIQRAIDGFGYNQQAALGDTACRAVLGRDMADFTLVMVEKKRPHCVASKTIKPADVTLGIEQNAAALRLFARCLDTGDWPGPGGHQSDAEYVGVSPRTETRIRERIADIERQLA